MPDWSVAHQVHIDRSVRLPEYEASGGQKADWIVLDPATVRTTAILLDQLTAFGGQMEYDYDIEATLRGWMSLARIDAESCGAGNHQTAAILNRSLSFWHTLFADILIYQVLGNKHLSLIDLEDARDVAEDHVYASFLAWYEYVTKTPRPARTPSIVDFQFAVDNMITLKRFATT